MEHNIYNDFKASLILKQNSKLEPQKSLSSFYNWYILKLNS